MKLPIGVNDAIQVKSGTSRSSSYCESRIEEVTEDELLISWPTQAGKRISVDEQQTLLISFSRFQRVYEFDATVIDVIDDPVAMLSIRPSGSPRTIQRRDDVRIRALAPVELTAKVVRLSRFKDARTRSHHIKSETVTISAGGFSIHYDAPIVVGSLFDAKLVLPGETGTLEMSVRTVRCISKEDPDIQPPSFEIGFAYTHIPQAARARIVRFVFGIQREERLEE
jgi:c-di-GMP-binding flagellar brake protein YcgR